jgi:4-hydroxybutyryl-CoA dehydratase / vinylacetyl-CoA-Delta-isomerase
LLQALAFATEFERVENIFLQRKYSEMGLMTEGQYKASLRDGRVVYLAGERVEDVTTHSILARCVETAAIDYRMTAMPEYQDLAVVANPQTGELINRYYHTAADGGDLLKKFDLMVAGSRATTWAQPLAHDIGADAMNAVAMTAGSSGIEKYVDRARKYHDFLTSTDASVAGAMTDVKGNRRLRPSSPDQTHPDFYVRVVARSNDGIVVRGAKAHITGAAYFNEILVMPGRSMQEQDKDYAVSFAIPVNTKGIRQIVRPAKVEYGPLEFPDDGGPRRWADSVVIFDDVFVPWERVFLCGEWQLSTRLMQNFATLHRFSTVALYVVIAETLVGMAQAMAEYNGIERAPHVVRGITELVIHCEMLKALARAACLDYAVHGGIPIPNPTTTNIAKYHFANEYLQQTAILIDIAGGLLATMPSYKDFQNPETRGDIEKYLGGAAGTSTVARLRMFQLHSTLLTPEIAAQILHGAGSLQGQRVAIYSESGPGIAKCKAYAQSLAGIRPAGSH